MKSLFKVAALAALVAVPASLPMATANAVDVASPVQTITVSGSTGLTF